MKKKFFAALLAMAMVLLMVPFAMAQEEKLEPDTAWYSDETTEYTIKTAEELAGLAQLVSGGNSFSGKTIKLGENIDLKSYEWTPIGVSGRPFSGTFNGNGKTISNLVITQPATSEIGLFGYTTGGEIKNFTLDNAQVTGYLNVGAVAGTPYTSKYTDIEVTGLIQVKGYAYVGGALGKNAYADITDVDVTGDPGSYVYADSENYRTYVGGLVGFMGEGAITIKDCNVVIDVTGSTRDVGGLLGILHYGNTMKNCTYKGSLTLTNPSGSVSSEFGALTGTVMNSKMPATITGCEATIDRAIYGNEDITDEITPHGDFYYDLNSDDNATGQVSVQATVNNNEVKVNNYVAYIEDTGYTSLAKAVAAANDATSPVTITIVASGEYDAFTLDAQNKNFTIVADDGVDVTVNVSAKTPLDLYDGYANQTSSFTFQNINFVSKDGSTIVTTYYFGKDNRKFTFDSCTFSNESGDPTGSIALYIDYPNVTIQNCEFTNWETGYYTAGEGYTMGTMNISGNRYHNVKTIVNGYWQHPVSDDSELTISGNTIDPGDWGNAAIVLWDWGQYQAWLDDTTSSVSTAIRAVVSDNTMVSGTMEYHKIHCDWFVPSDITLPENAEIINYYLIELDGDDITSCQVYDQNGNLVATLRNAAGKQYIYNLPEGDYTFQVTQERENGDNVVTTQTVTVAEPPEGTDTQVLQMQDISQVKVAKVGDVEYTTLADAIAAAGPGGIVKLLSSVEIGTTLNIDRSITIDGNGFEIVAKDCAAIYVAEDLESLTVQNLTLTGKSSDDSYVASENMEAPYMGLGNYHAEDPKGIGRIVLTDVEISGFDYGLYFGCKGSGEKTVSIDADRLNIHDCYIKGAYFEKLTDSTFTDSDFVDNGSNPNLVSDNYKKWMCGVDINLKYGEYENITFEDCTFIGNGSNDGTALHIKARDDGTSYGGGNAASLDGVTITGCTFADNNQPNNADTPIVLGEPNANNKTPVNVSIQPDVAFVNNLDRSSTVAVTFESNGGSSIATQIVGYGEKVDEPADPSRPGYVFEGWYKDNGLTTPWDFAMGTVTSPTTLYAKWSVYIPPVPSYLITLNDSDNGTITSDRTTARQGTTVTLTVTPDRGYALSALTIRNGSSTVPYSSLGNGRYSFVMPEGGVTVSAVFTRIRFTDVPTGEWYYDAVYWAVENGVTDGTSDTLFSPGRDVTRAEMVTFLWRAAGSPEPTTTVNPFEDVASSAYYYDAVLWAVENGITDGVSDTEFDPTGECTRAQMVTFLWRAENEPDVGTSNPFEDVDEEEYYYEAILWAAANGITDGMTDTTFVPDGNCTRAQAVTFLYRTMV